MFLSQGLEHLRLASNLPSNQDDVGFLIPLALLSKWWEYGVLGVKPRTLSMLGKHPTN